MDAGLGDPYWYEWSVGLAYVIDMLDPGSAIASVTLQKSGEKGLDDVVVRFANGDVRFIQVKHTRASETLTFGDLVRSGSAEPSLLQRIANAWNTEKSRTTGNCEAWLVTNRDAGRRQAVVSSGTDSIVRPTLDEFLAHVEREIVRATTTIAELNIPARWRDAWANEWLPQLDLLGDDTTKLQFMRQFRVCTSQEGLTDIYNTLVSKIAAAFVVDSAIAERLQARLDGALRIWATSLRGANEAITREAVFEKLCLTEDDVVGEHDLAPPAPFFETRARFGDTLVSLLVSREAPVVFLAGEPGSGKTALISSLANRPDPVVNARYHAYRPITPENQLLPADAGRTTSARVLWTDLLLEIRRLARGCVAELQIPVHAGSLTVDSLRGHVLRLAKTLGERQGRPFVIAIDGIDHAARAGAATESFLMSLVPPDQVPPQVVFLIGGQPPDGYPNYPSWLRVSCSTVRRIDLPGVELTDTLALVRGALA